MEKRKREWGGGNSNQRCMEENTLAMLDTSFAATDQHRLDDRLAFLEAVRSATLVAGKTSPPTPKMLAEIFKFLQEEDSLDLIMRIYQLLTELNKHYPRVYVSEVEKSRTTSPPKMPSELVAVEEAWSPFNGLDVASGVEVARKSSGGLFDAWNFNSLIKDIGGRSYVKECAALSMKSVRNFFVFQYLVDVIEDDFSLRNHFFKESMNWTVLRESILNMLLASRKITYKAVVKDCLSSMCNLCHDETASIEDGNKTKDSSVDPCELAIDLALPEVEKTTCLSLKKLLFMIMELDASRNLADRHGLITRVDGVRTPAAEIILDEVTYNKELLSPFLQIFDDSRHKLEMIVQYFQKYVPKPSVRTRRSNGGSGRDATFDGILNCLSNGTSAKGLIRKIGREAAQLLLAHAFQAYLSLLSQNFAENHKEDAEDSQLVETCKNILSAFTCLREDKQSDKDFLTREALFTAATIISMKSKEPKEGL